MHTFRYFTYTMAILALFCGSLALANHTYDQAYQLKLKGKHAEAIEGFLLAEKEALAQGDALTRFSSFYCASFSAHRLSRNSDCLEYAEAALRIAEDNRTAWIGRSKQPVFEIELIGLIERCYYNLARLGDGWQANRRGVDFLRAHYGHPSSEPLQPEEVLQFPRMMRGQGWRFIEREAEYLHETGNTTEAIELLEAAIVAATPDLELNDSIRSFYALKLIGKLGVIEGFVGYEPRAIELFELEYSHAEHWASRRNLIGIRMNFLAETVDYRGADDDMVAEADALLKEYEDAGYFALGAVKRLHARILAGRVSDDERLKSLLEAAQSGIQDELLVESFYASRNALFIRAANNESGLDQEFMDFLSQSRTQGNLRAEPRIYRRYGDWLRQQNRYGEALRVYRISLDRILVNEWHPQAIMLYSKIAAAYLDAGEPALALTAMQELNDYLEAHPEIPPHAVLISLRGWMIALLANGDYALARAEAERWYAFGVAAAVPEKHLLVFSHQFVEAFILEQDVSIQISQSEVGRGVLLHPRSVTTLGLPEQSARVAFFLLNSGSAYESGQLKVSGNGLVQLSAPSEQPIIIQQNLSETETSLFLPLSLSGGTLRKLYLQQGVAPDATIACESHVRLEWISSQRQLTDRAIWHYSLGEATEFAAVIDAAEISPNPYIGVPVEHTIYFPPELQQLQLPIRIRASQPFRIEYRDPTTGGTIAVDNNGNGDFNEAGDFWKPNRGAHSEVNAPRVTRIEHLPYGSIEVWYFPDEPTSPRSLDLTVEVFDGEQWLIQAVDQIQLSNESIDV
jgi:tetratricopeptide (TPR) repeat protein